MSGKGCAECTPPGSGNCTFGCFAEPGARPYDDLIRARDLLNTQPYRPDPPMPPELALLLSEYRAQDDLLHQIRSIVNEYRSGAHWSSQGMERIGSLLDGHR